MQNVRDGYRIYTRNKPRSFKIETSHIKMFPSKKKKKKKASFQECGDNGLQESQETVRDSSSANTENNQMVRGRLRKVSKRKQDY